jgi:hypothetical protein
LDSVVVLSEQTTVENVMFGHPKSFSPALLEGLTAHIQALSLITTALLRRTKLEEWQRLGEPVQSAEMALRRVIAEYVQRLANFLQNGPRPERCEMDQALAAWNQTTADITGNDRPRLVRRLVDQIHRLI